jgi:ribA/ribD-fused uncharacterized protein
MERPGALHSRGSVCWFFGDYHFLSNFHPLHPYMVHYEGDMYTTVEHAYQAAKSLDPVYRRAIQACWTPGEAKKLGRSIKPRKDWTEAEKIRVMRMLLKQKFGFPPFQEKLAATAPHEIVEHNWWGDDFWGRCTAQGQNWLGRLLMEIRDGKDPAVSLPAGPEPQGSLF